MNGWMDGWTDGCSSTTPSTEAVAPPTLISTSAVDATFSWQFVGSDGVGARIYSVIELATTPALTTGYQVQSDVSYLVQLAPLQFLCSFDFCLLMGI